MISTTPRFGIGSYYVPGQQHQYLGFFSTTNITRRNNLSFFRSFFFLTINDYIYIYNTYLGMDG